MAIPLRPLPSQVPDLTFAVTGISALQHSVAPTIAFHLAIAAAGNAPVDSTSLQVQFRLAANGRRYLPEERERLAGLFGTGSQWARSVGSLHWANVTTVVPPFEGSTSIDVPVPLTYDFDVATAQYLQALTGGDVPVDLLFSGTIFYPDENGTLQAAMIPWEKEARCMLPVATWREAMDVHFPGTAWLRVSQATLDALQRYRARHAATDWDGALGALLKGESQ